MNDYKQRQLEKLDEFIERKRKAKEKFMREMRDESNASIDCIGFYYIPAAIITIISLILIFSIVGCAYSSEIKEELAVRSILGEASGEGIEGMRAVASAIRNRGTLKGVYGLKAPHVDKQPAWVWKLARQAWQDSKRFDYANGADHWEGTAFKTPYWAKDMILVKTVKNQRFYKRRS